MSDVDTPNGWPLSPEVALLIIAVVLLYGRLRAVKRKLVGDTP
jgi:hypothetical protein